MPLVSVIIPVFNVRKYLENCVRSVLAQTVTDWELILVDDGSSDGSDALARALAEKDGRIAFLSRPGGGVGAARNAGIDAAAGEYLAFLDSDDAWEPDHLDTLLSLASSAGADVSAAGALAVDEEGRILRRMAPEPGVFSGTETILDAFLRRSGGLYSCWNKLFRRETVGELRFTAHTRAEDALFCTRVLERTKVYAVTDAPTYRYLRRGSSVTMAGFDERSPDQVRAWTQIAGIVERSAPKLTPFAANKICHDVDGMYAACRRAGRREDLAFLKSAHVRFYPKQFAPGTMSARKKAAAALFRLSPELYYRLAGN